MSIIEDKNKQISNQGTPVNLPKYEEDFGHQFERNLASALRNKLGEIIEETEMATPEEDQKQKVDVWVKFWGIEDPIALQVTFTSNKERMDKKDKDISQNPIIKKKERNDALIKAPRSSDLVLVSFDKSQVKSGKIDERLLADTLRQIMAGLPSHSKAFFLKKIGEKMEKAGKKFPT
jgi:hypothetical protein